MWGVRSAPPHRRPLTVRDEYEQSRFERQMVTGRVSWLSFNLNFLLMPESGLYDKVSANQSKRSTQPAAWSFSDCLQHGNAAFTIGGL